MEKNNLTLRMGGEYNIKELYEMESSDKIVKTLDEGPIIHYHQGVEIYSLKENGDGKFKVVDVINLGRTGWAGV